MPGIKTSIPKLTLLFAAIVPAFGASSDYFPLEVGNSWVYRSESRHGGQQGAAVEVVRSEYIGEKQWFVTNFFGRETLLRLNESGTLVSYDRGSRAENVWIPFASGVGESFETSIDSCTESGRIESKSAEHKGPLGESKEGLRIAYEPRCADAGVTSATFVPQIGLAEYSTTSIAGPVVYKLVYARTGVTVRTDAEWSFGISLDSPSYTQPAVMAVRLTLRNTQTEPIRIQFPSGQDYDVVIRNEAGESVYTWSADKAFAAVFRTIEFGPGERNWLIEIPLSDIEPGVYTVEGSLGTNPRSYVATTSVDIRAGN